MKKILLIILLLITTQVIGQKVSYYNEIVTGTLNYDANRIIEETVELSKSVVTIDKNYNVSIKIKDDMLFFDYVNNSFESFDNGNYIKVIESGTNIVYNVLIGEHAFVLIEDSGEAYIFR